MVKKSETTSQQRHKVVILREIGYSCEKTRKNLEFTARSTTQSTYSNYLHNGSVLSQKRSGRPGKPDHRDQRDIKRIIGKGNKSSAEHILTILNSFSQKTVCTKSMRNEFHKMGYKGPAAAKKVCISPASRQKACSGQ